MDRVNVGGVDLEYEVQGRGEPVLLIHGAHIAGAMRPLLGRDALEPLRLIRYHRRGFAGSSRPGDPATTTDHVADALGLLGHLALDQAHVVGHSYGGVIALELAASHPTRVTSLALLEPALLAVPASAVFARLLAPVVERYDDGDPAGAVDDFLAIIGGPAWRDTIERSIRGGVEQAHRDAATFFEAENNAVAQWSFGPEQATAISCRVLSVVGTNSGPLFAQGRELLHTWFPDCEDADIAGATHLLPMEAPTAVAETIASFVRSDGNRATRHAPT